MSKQAMTFDKWFAEECPLMCKDDPWARTTAWSAWLAAWDAAQKAIKQHDAEPVGEVVAQGENVSTARVYGSFVQGTKLYLSAPSIPEGTDKVIAFAQEIMSDVWPMGGLDGGDLQDLAEKHGLLTPETRHEPCGENCICAGYALQVEFNDGVTCYRKHPILLSASPQPTKGDE